ncbi:MAG TPA: nucleoside-diphosphate sugar epimerase/dehydratase [Bacteroidia bacterium]|nr:nucleoside-diphosphate sugar epimerase/dehydratase [Bacteroidia bacterium]HNU33964.1 nucleoside-diphosphate sugar epimerase/dehydratase [Bacteroidia bacterium]
MFKANTPRWLIFFADVIICAVSVLLAYLLRFNFRIPLHEVDLMAIAVMWVVAVRIVGFIVSKTYQGIIRFSNYKDSQRIFLTLLAGTIFIGIFNKINFAFNGKYLVPYSILIIDFFISVLFMTSYRVIVKMLYDEYAHRGRKIKRSIIYGAGEEGLLVKRAFQQNTAERYAVNAFVDDNPKLAGRKLEGVEVFNASTDLETLLRINNIDYLVVPSGTFSIERINQLVELCSHYNTRLLTVPPLRNLINGKLTFNQIKEINIEDLLERDPIMLDERNVNGVLSSKTILITGAAGSIGSEIARQVLAFTPAKIVLLDCAESPLHELDMEMKDFYRATNTEVVLADIRNEERMQRVFEHFKPHLVFHAAAYKHVPLIENNPSEAILTNIAGTKILADLSVKHNVEKFILISTDKAVNPTNVMGASKRVAEIYCQSLNERGKTKFVTTRFGNVLGSAGSVIPRFKSQIEKRQSVTVTHPDITRFFMTIPEACRLVLEAGAMGNGGEIYVFDMGQPVKVVDLARKMIKLAGLEPDVDIKIEFTGLRPGEKLFEEVLNEEENTMHTHHPKILIAKVRTYNFSEISLKVDEVINLFKEQDNFSLVARLKDLVPEYISNNSEFEKLDAGR